MSFPLAEFLYRQYFIAQTTAEIFIGIYLCRSLIIHLELMMEAGMTGSHGVHIFSSRCSLPAWTPDAAAHLFTGVTQPRPALIQPSAQLVGERHLILSFQGALWEGLVLNKTRSSVEEGSKSICEQGQFSLLEGSSSWPVFKYLHLVPTPKSPMRKSREVCISWCQGCHR